MGNMDSINQGLIKKEIKPEDVELFGRFLSRLKGASGKSATKVAEELNISGVTLNKWENGIAFPDEDKLIDIAKVYEIELTEVQRVFKISKEAREIAKKDRRSLRNPKKNKPNYDF